MSANAFAPQSASDTEKNDPRAVQDGLKDSDLVPTVLVAMRAPAVDILERTAAQSVIRYLATDGEPMASRLRSFFGDEVSTVSRGEFTDACKTIRIAATRTLNARARMLPWKRLTESPRLFHWSQVLTPAERLYLQEITRPHLQPAGVRNRLDRRLEYNEQRVAADGILPAHDPFGLWLERHLAHQVTLDLQKTESLTIVRYPEGGHFAPHCDAVHPLGREVLHPSDIGGARVASIILYLNDDYLGGETAFVRRGLKIRARAGDGIVFFNHRPDGEVDLEAMHAALPVEKGEKWVALLWFRENAAR